MGIEAFSVVLLGPKDAADGVVAFLCSSPRARAAPPTFGVAGATCFVIDDGRHVIEAELFVGQQTRLSCRFALCHPPTAVEALLRLARSLLAETGLTKADCPDTDAGPFALAEFEGFAAEVRRAAASRREEWVSLFGPETAAVGTDEAVARFVLPRCEPVS